ncbi:MAG: tetratricopeptide repeat protein [Burkholderiales bacterium]
MSRSNAARRLRRDRPVPWLNPLLVALAAAIVAWSSPVRAAESDLARAEALVGAGKYQEAYDLLAPVESARKGDADFDYLLGRAALGTKRAGQALALFERSLATRPDSVAARLALGRAYFALGRYAEAKIEFETVLQFGDLPPDLLTQVETYDQAARQFLDEGKRLTGFGYAEIGIGRYRVNDTPATTSGEREDTFYNARIGGALNYALDGGNALDASLDYRFRYYDSDVRNDSDWRWRTAWSRAFGESNLAIGFRGRNSYRGESTFRNDYGIFSNYRYRLDPDNQLTFGAQVWRRSYPNGRLRERSRSTVDASIGWVHSLLDGRATFTLTGHGGYNYATSRPDGNSAIYGATVNFDYAITNRLDGFIFGWYERDAFNTDRIHFHPDSLDETAILRRKDNLYEIGGGLVWEFAPTWSLRPEVLWIRDQSNSVNFNYSSTEVWINLRKGF